MKRIYGHFAAMVGVAAIFGFTLVPLCPAQDTNNAGSGVGSGSISSGPVRMARISYATGSIAFRASDSVDWAGASPNLPLRQGAEIWAKTGKASIQFDDGSVMRIGDNAVAVLQTLYSDSNGEFTEIKFDSGLTTLHLRSNLSEFQVDTPACAVKAYGPAVVRISVNGNDVEVIVRSGEAEVDAGQGAQTLKAGQSVHFGAQGTSVRSRTSSGAYLYGSRTPQRYTRYSGGSAAQGYSNQSSQTYQGSGSAQGYSSQGYSGQAAAPVDTGGNDQYAETESPAPPPDNWDNWSSQQDSSDFYVNSNVPSDVNLMAGDLDNQGTWHDDSTYGEVWCPIQASNPSWCPYQTGSWTWVAPFGWTYCGAEPWGWAPYHYGTWYHARWGWSWCPGPAYQYWSPAVVDFCDNGSSVAWAPLCPWEVQYPAAFSIGFSAGNWALSFSIGQAGCYFPFNSSYCVGRPWSNAFVNRNTNIYNITTINNYYGQTAALSNGVFGVNNRFHPFNAFRANGATVASRTAFVNGGRFQRLPQTRAAIFNRGRSFTAPPTRGPQLSGPPTVRPSRNAFSPSHRTIAARPPDPILRRAVFRAPVTTAIARQSGNPGRVRVPSTRVVARIPRTGLTPKPGVRPNMQRNVPNRVAANQPPRTTRPKQPASTRVAARAPSNRYNRFNSVSKSPFTNVQRNVTRNAMRSTSPVARRSPSRAGTVRAPYRPAVAPRSNPRTQPGALRRPNIPPRRTISPPRRPPVNRSVLRNGVSASRRPALPPRRPFTPPARPSRPAIPPRRPVIPPNRPIRPTPPPSRPVVPPNRPIRPTPPPNRPVTPPNRPIIPPSRPVRPTPPPSRPIAPPSRPVRPTPPPWRPIPPPSRPVRPNPPPNRPTTPPSRPVRPNPPPRRQPPPPRKPRKGGGV